jgi:hypothetical protein
MPEISLTTQLSKLVNQRAHAFSVAEFSRIRGAITDALDKHQKRENLTVGQLMEWLRKLDDSELKRIAKL